MSGNTTAAGSIIGGTTGARLVHGSGRKFVRDPIAIVAIGLVMTVALCLKHP